MAVGYWIEFTTPDAEFVKLDVAWPQTTTFRHPDVAPETTFIYRLVPFFGRVSNVVAMNTGPASREQAPSVGEGTLGDPGSGPTTGRATAKKSIRTISTMAEAAPANLAIVRSSPGTAELRWEDRAADEDGYLVELAQTPEDFKICALLPPDTTSFRKVSLPPETELRFRVRAFFDGEPSKLASVTTAAEIRPR
jgi:hypothetical protein